MNCFLLDASALVKRYHPEIGTVLLNHLFADALARNPQRIVVSVLTITESVAALQRRGNEKSVPPQVMQITVAKLLSEARSVARLGINNRAVLRSIPLLARHNINSSDAILLGQALRLRRFLREHQLDAILMTADKRLLRAAMSEGLRTLDAETATLDEVTTLLMQP